MVTLTLNLLQNWFIEPSQGNDRSKLLSKMATIEFCGWLEHWMDDFILELSNLSLRDELWTKSDVILKTSGFEYINHLRPMMCKLIGEHHVRMGERRFEAAHPGDLDQIKSMLGSNWKIRCSFAHSDLVHNIATQVTFNAPSWTINQHRILEKKLENLKIIFVAFAQDFPNN